MAIGPVQLIVLGFSHPEFHGEIVAELERLKESDTVRVIDALAVHKDAEGEIGRRVRRRRRMGSACSLMRMRGMCWRTFPTIRRRR